MLIFYNIIHFLFILLFFPFLVLYILLRKKYRTQIPRRLGFSLKKVFINKQKRKKCIWVHAISVGEVTSALPLVSKISQQFPESSIVFSASTHTGYELAQDILGQYCDQIIAFPLDFYPVVTRFLNIVKPNFFILIETDFWPNFLTQLQKRNIPAILVNGRISADSSTVYRRFSSLSKTIFQSFEAICVQNESDRSRFMEFNVHENKIHKFGNLKFEPITPKYKETARQLLATRKEFLLLAGSTHPGEEDIVLQSFLEIKNRLENVQLVIAPRKIERTPQIIELCNKFQLSVQKRTDAREITCDVFILDTLGELTSFYSEADICLVGGSILDSGGHNPLEPAALAKPVLFGKYMSDFEEISSLLLSSGAAFQVEGSQELTKIVVDLLTDKKLRQKCGNSAYQCVAANNGVIEKHINLIRDLI